MGQLQSMENLLNFSFEIIINLSFNDKSILEQIFSVIKWPFHHFLRKHFTVSFTDNKIKESPAYTKTKKTTKKGKCIQESGNSL